jgi:hypothetical protein
MKPNLFAIVAGMLFSGPAVAVAPPDVVVFSVRQPGAGSHWYENFGYYAQDDRAKAYRALGRLCRLDVRTGKVTVLLDDPQGSIRDPQVHYDGAKILFSYRPGGEEHFHLYEIRSDGTGLRQLTFGLYTDIEPTYLPDGRIMFCSNRCNRWVNCWFTQVAVLYTCDADGKDLRPISANIEHDNTPWPMPDGRVLYLRWEYVDRSRVSFHHLWTANPDGTAQMVYFGNQHPGTVMIDAKPIPGTDKVLAVFSPGHGKAEHAGAVAMVSPKAGPDAKEFARRISQGDDFRDPYPLSENSFLVARGPSLLIMNGHGETTEIYRLPQSLIKAGAECHEPRPLKARPREPVIPARIVAQATGAPLRSAPATPPTGRLVVSDVHLGRRMEGVRRGEIKKLLVLETLPKPVNESGKMPPMSFGGTFTLERVLGTVPVEPDGSAYMEVPALRSLFFVALDEHDNSVQRMMSFLTVMPGETTSCVGCHEDRTRTPDHASGSRVMAIHRAPSRIEPLSYIPDVFDFPRDIQPILDRHCVRCHDYGRRDGGVVLCGDRGPIFSHSYYALTALEQVSDGRDRLVTNLPPRAIGTSASPLMRKLDGSHYGVVFTRHEKDMVRYWIESAIPYPGTYAALGTGMIGGYPKSVLDTTDRKWPVSVAAAEAIRRRCTGCHDRTKPMPQYLSDDLGLVLSNPDPADVRIRWSRHLMFNLTHPEKSLILLAPLAKEAGGYGRCGAKVFADAGEADYQRILALCREGKRHLEATKRFDMPGFRPATMYVREMKRYGVLPKELGLDDPIDVYATDQAYWRSLWPLGTEQSVH